jgi:hypothetical protein
MELKPFHSAWVRQDGTYQTFDLSKAREPRIPVWRRCWLWLTAPYRNWRWRRMFAKGLVIVRADHSAGTEP